MAGLSDIAGRCACLARRQGVSRFVFDIERVGVIGMRVVTTRLTLLAPGRAFCGERAHVEALPKQVNALQEGQALDQPSDPVVDGEPGFVGRGMTVAAPPATDRFLESWGEAAFTATIGSHIGRHGRILIGLTAPTPTLPRERGRERLGEAENPVGRWLVQMAAGTNGGAAVYRTYYEAGVDTILAMHIDERDLMELEQLQRPRASS
jgi:hypothetical protein